MAPRARYSQRGSAAAIGLIVAAVLHCLAHTGSAYPYYWADPIANLGAGVVPQCTAHPSTARGGHKAPTQDTSITFALTPVAGGSASQTVCPGQTYAVRVTWGSGTRHALLTAPFGSTFRSSLASNQNTAVYYYSSAQGINCTNRLVTAVEAASLSDQVTVPCNASGTYDLKVTSATGQNSAFLFNTASLTVNAACAASTCPTTADPSPPPSPPLPPSPPPAPTPAPAPPPSPVTNVTGGCQPSSMNYTCSSVMGGVRVHYSVGGAMPDNACTRGQTLTLAQGQTLDSVLHMAVEAVTTGYVALAFAQSAGAMAPADAVLGWSTASGNSQVGTYRITDQSLSASQVSNWALVTGVARVGSSAVVCFTRALTSPNATNSRTIDPSQNLQLNWAVSPSAAFVTHQSSGGGTLNILTGSTTAVADKKNLRIRWHGALMSAGWALLLPLGALFPPHRWVFRDSKLFGAHVWFRLHVALQCLGFGLVTAGFAIAYYYLGDPSSYAGDVGETHQVLGTIVYGMACVQLLAGFFRPAVDSPHRPWFTHGHRWFGRVALVASWVTIYLGIKVYHKSIYNEDMTPWLAVVSAVLGVIVLTDLALYAVAFLWPGAATMPQEQRQDAAAPSDMEVKYDTEQGVPK